MESNMVETRGLKKYYRLGDNVVKALDGVDFTVREQEFVAIIGRSGSGKSTLLHMVGGLDTPTEGDVYVAGRNLSGMTKEELAAKNEELLNDTMKKEASIGVANVNRRLKAVYGRDYGILMEAREGGGLRVILRFPTVESGEKEETDYDESDVGGK